MLLVYPLLRTLQVNFKQKFVLFCLFSLGVFSIMCNVGKSIAFLDEPYVNAYIWSTTEITVAIICASIPSLRPLFFKTAWRRRTGHVARRDLEQPEEPLTPNAESMGFTNTIETIPSSPNSRSVPSIRLHSPPPAKLGASRNLDAPWSRKDGSMNSRAGL